MPPITGRYKIPTTSWRIAKEYNPKTKIAVSISWDWIRHFYEEDIVDYYFRGKGNDKEVTESMVKFIKKK